MPLRHRILRAIDALLRDEPTIPAAEQQPQAPAPVRPPQHPGIPVRDLHEHAISPGSGDWRHHDHQGVWAVHPGKVKETRKPLPPPAQTAAKLRKGFPALLGDLRREPARFGFKPGAPIRYWAILSVRAGAEGEHKLEELRLYEVI